jgi:hypothetical protein
MPLEAVYSRAPRSPWPTIHQHLMTRARAIPPTTKTKQFPIDATNLEHPGDFGVVFGIEALADVLRTFIGERCCQSASKFDPLSASNFDPLWRRVLAVALAPSELVGVAETARARVVV